MDKVSATLLSEAIRGSGLYSSEQILEATRILDLPLEPVAMADQLFACKILTPYMYRKIRAGRTAEILFGPYLILDKIGEGGMGKVYRAVQCLVGQMVALKVVRQHLMANKTVKARYKKEAAAAAALNHPNVVKLFEADEINGRYYLAMEYIDGIDLARMVKEFGSPPVSGLPHYQEACEYVRQAALGLQHAHENGLIHRDIKPSNLLVFGDRALPGTTGQAQLKILDMGLVRSLIEDEDASKTELTRDGTVVGTPDYMSPEQAKNSSTVDYRADLYSLGCTLYYLLRGRPPFPDGSPIDKLLRHQLDAPPDIRAERRDVPQAVADIVNKLLAKKADDRYQTAAQAAEALARVCQPGTLEEGYSTEPAHEPFSFTDDPSDIYQPPPPSAAEAKARTETMAKAATVPSRPAAATAPPSVRLRVVTPKATPQTAPVPVRAMNVTIPKADKAPSSDSLPSSRTPVKTGISRAETDNDADAITPRKTRRAPAKAAPPPPKRKPILLFAAIGIVCVVGMVVVGLFLFKLNKPDSSSSTTPTVPATTTPTTNKVSPTVANSRVLALEDMIPSDTHGVIMFHPTEYWKRVAYEKPVDVRLTAHIEQLVRRLRVDPKECRRGILSFSTRSDYATLVAEGPFLTPTWIENFEKFDGIKTTETLRGGKRFTLTTPFQTLKYAALLGNDAFVASSSRDIPLQLMQQYQEKKPSDGLRKELLRAVNKNAETLPLLAFTATGSYNIPDGGTLSDRGISFANIIMSMNGNDFIFKISLRGASNSRISDFISIYLSTKMVEQHPRVKPLTDILADAEKTEVGQKDYHAFEMEAKLPWTLAHEVLEGLLPNLTEK
jgi:eukaryotic-like serine/threonine-protein kinase